MTRCAECRSKELRNRCADLRRGIREEREVDIENFELRSCKWSAKIRRLDGAGALPGKNSREQVSPPHVQVMSHP